MEQANTITAVIPVLGDHAELERLLANLSSLNLPPDEVIVVDGAAADSCAAICEKYACHYAASRPGRGVQLNAGLERTSGTVAWFLHADAVPPMNAIALIREAIAKGATGGYFRFRFSGDAAWYKTFLSAMINWRAGIGVPYGDQALFFQVNALREAGGFSDAPLFEEVAPVRAIRRSGRFIELPATIGVSPRRWERDGWIRRTLENRALAIGHAIGISPHVLARRYRPGQSNGTAQC